ncbi:hypothetical protein ACWPKO_28630 (plasmid) [Coraliomargarita sp. W4R53]
MNPELPPSITHTPLTAQECAFVIAAGVSDATFTEAAAKANADWIDQSATAIDSELSSWATSDEVAKVLEVKPAEVSRMRQHGELIAATCARLVSVLPRWQFTNGGEVLPCLQAIIDAFPADFHPLDIEAVMTRAVEELGGVSPKTWLETGSDVGRVVELIYDLSRI